jgi:hypothetical protein
MESCPGWSCPEPRSGSLCPPWCGDGVGVAVTVVGTSTVVGTDTVVGVEPESELDEPDEPDEESEESDEVAGALVALGWVLSDESAGVVESLLLHPASSRTSPAVPASTHWRRVMCDQTGRRYGRHAAAPAMLRDP